MVTNQRYIPPERKRLLPIIKQTVPRNGDIAAMTHMGLRTVERALSNYENYGDVVPPRKGPAGRPRALNRLDVCYLDGLVEKRPDSTLAELRDDLYTAMGVYVDGSTISRTLARRGYSYVQVCFATHHH
ncbi:hypothetical protein GGX14DRAFT_353193 [Mycena pura]|uniref:Uncharacterized protein n=1 Tax=Mycena pura TaxID=153505 RepID=A0AAD6YI45_9AGAR|nr:hypothetical protein GGX14DRAFT_354276 [Mycena pura]KAJ7221516.1 hypothetical protein GGX14DRAFT_353193 [Mycena pura]